NLCVPYVPFCGELSLCGLSHLRDCEHESIPARFLRLELLPAGARELVKLRFASGFVHVPARRDPALLLDAVERRVERTLLDVEHLVRELSNTLNDSVAVQLSQRERFEDQHIERSL